MNGVLKKAIADGKASKEEAEILQGRVAVNEEHIKQLQFMITEVDLAASRLGKPSSHRTAPAEEV